MNPIPTIPSVTQFGQQNPLMPAMPNFSFSFGQGSWEKPFTPDATLVSTLLSKLRTGEVDFNQAAGQLAQSANNPRISQNLNPEELKQALVKSFGGQSFQAGPMMAGAEGGQIGHFNEKNYGFIPETTKNIVSRVTGMGASTKINALKGGLPTIPKL